MIEFLPHTADIRLRVTAASLEELFTEALSGMYRAIGGVATGDVAEEVDLVVDAVDETSLLVDFLNEVLWRTHVHRLVYEARSLEFSGPRLRARLAGHPAAEFADEIKAVTYHEAEIGPTADGRLETLLVFDV